MHFHIIVAIAENIDQVGTFFIDGFRYCIWHGKKETGHPSLFTITENSFSCMLIFSTFCVVNLMFLSSSVLLCYLEH